MLIAVYLINSATEFFKNANEFKIKNDVLYIYKRNLFSRKLVALFCNASGNIFSVKIID